MAAPSQSREEDKALRGQIRGLLNRAKHDKHNLVNVENNRIVEIVRESNQYVDKVKRPRDQAVDAELFNIITEVSLEYVTKLRQGGSNFTAGDFISRLKTRHVSDTDAQLAGAEDPMAFEWAALGQLPLVAVLFRSVPVVHHLLGPMDAQPRVRRQVQRQAKRKQPVGPASRPEEVEDLQDQEKQETDRNMEVMWKVLRECGGRVSLLDLVINHASFAQTNENLFTLAFLVRDNKVGFEEDEEEGLMVLQRLPGKQEPKEKGGEAERMQFVIVLDIDTWELWKQATDASRPPMMKHRKERRQEQRQAAAVQQQQQQQQEQQQVEDPEEPRQQVQQAPRRQSRGQREQPQQEEEKEEEEQEQQPQRKKRKAAAVPVVNFSEGVGAGGAGGGGIVISDSEEGSPPQKEQQAPATQATQQGTQKRMPMRGRRA